MPLRPSRRTAAALTVPLALLVFAALATAQPIADAQYAGGLTGHPGDFVTFTVSANGKKVTKLEAPILLGCAGGGVGAPAPATAAITKKGTFSATLPYLAPGGGASPGATVTVTGKFGKEASERGTVTSNFSGKSCDASAKYVATAAAR